MRRAEAPGSATGLDRAETPGSATRLERAEQIGVDFYSCEEAIKRLNEYLDHELDDEERLVVVRHLEICKPCLSRFTFEEKLIVSLRSKLCGMGAPQKLKDRLKGMLRSSGGGCGQ